MKQPVLYDWEVQVFLLQHLRFQGMTDGDFEKISRQKIVPDPRGVHLATLYSRSMLEFASKNLGDLLDVVLLMPLYSSFDGIHFQELYNRCKAQCSIEQEANPEELNFISPYFELVTSNGKRVKQ